MIQRVLSAIRFWKDGPIIRNNSSVIESRNAANSAFAVHRVATPVAANDATTKSYVDTAIDTDVAAALLSNVESRVVALAYTDTGDNNLGAVLPAGANVIAAFVQVGTLFDGTTPVLKIGDAVDDDGVMLTTDNDLTTVGLYTKAQITNFASSAQLLANLTIGGSPSQGACDIVILFSRAAS